MSATANPLIRVYRRKQRDCIDHRSLAANYTILYGASIIIQVMYNYVYYEKRNRHLALSQS